MDCRSSYFYVKVHQTTDCGFTLIEMLISVSMGLLLLAGLTTMFVSMSNTSRALSSRTERMSDLYLASQIMQEALRESKKICKDVGTNRYRIIYQPIDSPNAPDPGGVCNTGAINSTNGSFEMRDAGGSTHPTPYICWHRPNKSRCEEMIRGFYAPTSVPPGLDVLPPAGATGVWTITLTAKYMNESKQSVPLSLRFKTWARN